MAGKKWSQEEDKILQEMYSYNHTRTISGVIGRSERAIYCRAISKGLRKDEEYLNSPASGRLLKGQSASRGTCFKKGQVPWNKNKKGLQIGGIDTQFKKGNLPHNTKADNSISIRPDSRGIEYKHIRISLAKWIPLHRYNWEKVNGPIPKGMKLIFKDKDTMNCEIENLELVTPGELMKRNSLHNYPKPIAKAIQLRGALNRQINKHLKKFNDEKQDQ